MGRKKNSFYIKVILLGYNILNIKRILDSFYSQTNQDFVILAVNNYKNDLSFEICKNYERHQKVNIKCFDFGDLTKFDKMCKCLNTYNTQSFFVQVIDCNEIFELNPCFLNSFMQQVSSNKFINGMTYDLKLQQFMYLNKDTLDEQSIFFLNSKNALSEYRRLTNRVADKHEETSRLIESSNKDAKVDPSCIQKYNCKDNFDIFVSVIVASFNYEKYIAETLQSLADQTYNNFEVIIVDDGSTDNSVQIINNFVEKYSFMHLYMHDDKKNHGLPSTVKLGVQNSKGEYIAFCESDDTLDKNYLLEKVKLIDKYNEIPTTIVNDVNVFGDEQKSQRLKTLAEYRKTLFKEECNTIPIQTFKITNLICTFSSCMVKKNQLLKCNYQTPYDVELDWWLWYQLVSLDNKIFYIDKKLTNWRAHESFISKSSDIDKHNTFIKQLDILDASVCNTVLNLNNSSSQPFFSIVMPTHNRKNCICQAIDSVVQQTCQNFQLVIVDDGSIDQTEDMVKIKYDEWIQNGKIKYIKIENHGVSYARNIGLKNSIHEWICYLDSDDYYDKNYLALISSVIVNNKEYKTFILQTELTKNLKAFDYNQLVWLNYIQIESFIHHKSLFTELGGFDECMERLVDWELELKYTGKYPSYYITTPTKLFTVCTDNSSNRITDNNSTLNKNFNIVRRRYARRVFPTITTVIVSYNNQKYLKQAIESVLDQKGQFVHEIVISDDGSTDGSQEIISQYEKQYPELIFNLSQKDNVGIARNMKRCIDFAHGEYISILESDDYYTDKFRIRKMQEFLQKHQSCNMVFSKLQTLNMHTCMFETMPVQSLFKPELVEDDMFNYNKQCNCIFNLSTIMCDAKILKSLPKDLFFKDVFSEIPLAFYFFKHGKIGFIDYPLSIYRLHDSFYSGKSKIEKLKFSLKNRQIALQLCSSKYKKQVQDEIDAKKKMIENLEH